MHVLRKPVLHFFFPFYFIFVVVFLSLSRQKCRCKRTDADQKHIVCYHLWVGAGEYGRARANDRCRRICVRCAWRPHGLIRSEICEWKKKIARARKMIISLFHGSLLLPFLFRGSVSACCTVVASVSRRCVRNTWHTKKRLFILCGCFSHFGWIRAHHIRRIQIKDSVKYRPECFVLFCT